MRWRTLRVFILVFQALWLNVIVPGHRRGIVALPGENSSACAHGKALGAECCDMDSGGDRGKKGEEPSGPKGDPALHCAICYFAARVTPADFIDLTLPPLAFSHRALAPVAEIRTSVATIPTYDGRAPPVDC